MYGSGGSPEIMFYRTQRAGTVEDLFLSRGSPVIQALEHGQGHLIPGFEPFHAAGQEAVVRDVRVADMSLDRKSDGVFLEVFRRG